MNSASIKEVKMLTYRSSMTLKSPVSCIINPYLYASLLNQLSFRTFYVFVFLIVFSPFFHQVWMDPLILFTIFFFFLPFSYLWATALCRWLLSYICNSKFSNTTLTFPSAWLDTHTLVSHLLLRLNLSKTNLVTFLFKHLPFPPLSSLFLFLQPLDQNLGVIVLSTLLLA